MAECVTDQDWRTLMDTRLFEPLDIDASMAGRPSTIPINPGVMF
jgi:CubicO group peptidase (beta-lactamase class C family)